MKHSLLFIVCAILATPVHSQTVLNKTQCSLPEQVVTNLLQRNRGPVDGGTDENKDGTVDHIEAFTTWDFQQIIRVLHQGVEQQEYKWTNVDTCFQFNVTAGEYYEDPEMPLLWQTCRTFKFEVHSPSGKYLGSEITHGCRNYTTMEWEIM